MWTFSHIWTSIVAALPPALIIASLLKLGSSLKARLSADSKAKGSDPAPAGSLGQPVK